ncbi:hypothetical protein [Chelativorans alearense]|uniref:hypothetical protein n=1 Tax=Chelativorans alearense TaxID=2681495 RepID=UPI0013D7506D|nr:hypothetical protein [Chelativorans alearense]
MTILVLSVVLAGCTQTIGSIAVGDQAYKTDPACERTKPLGQYDEKCDTPRLGFKDFSPWTTVPRM